MLPKSNRLISGFFFKITRKYGQCVKTSFFDVYWLENKDLSKPTQVGFVISNIYVKHAVDRNRIKRLFREYFRLNFDKISKGYFVVVYPKPICADKKYEDISAEFNKVLSKISFFGKSGNSRL